VQLVSPLTDFFCFAKLQREAKQKLFLKLQNETKQEYLYQKIIDDFLDDKNTLDAIFLFFKIIGRFLRQKEYS
jgi:hypothetical protein